MRTAQPDKHTNVCGCHHSGEKPCGCHEPPPPECCLLPCPERPRYFCGQLLSDADLAAEQRYFREKQKMYHRAFHGHGVVCGLKLSCDPYCDNHVLVGRGFALDECGNDLVVCEPLHFDVTEGLHELGASLFEDEPEAKRRRPNPSRCSAPECYQVALCYHEEPLDFVEPFGIDCDPKPGACEPSRIRETVKVKLVREGKLPPTWQSRLTERLRCCRQMFSEGPFAELYRVKSSIFSKVKDGAPLGTGTSADDLRNDYEALRYALLVYVRQHSCLHDCSFDREIRNLPTLDAASDQKATVSAICDVQRLVHRTFGECLADAAIFDCDEPCCPACVVVGSVEVDLTTGTLLRVNNCPRKYVWTLAHLPEVLLASLASSLSCRGEGDCGGNSDGLENLAAQLLKPASHMTTARRDASHGPQTLLEQILTQVQETAAWPRRFVESPAQAKFFRTELSEFWNRVTAEPPNLKSQLAEARKRRDEAVAQVLASKAERAEVAAQPSNTERNKKLAQIDALISDCEKEVTALGEEVKKLEAKIGEATKAQEQREKLAKAKAELEEQLRKIEEAVAALNPDPKP